MAYPDSWIYRIGADGLERVSLEETEHYILAKRFSNDPKGQLERLFDE
jgi:predicted ATPase